VTTGAFTQETKALIWLREAGCCAACGRNLNDGSWYSHQHRRARGMGGSRRASTSDCTNGLLVCGSATSRGGCHLAIEAHPAWALSKGYRVGQTRDPATIPVWVAHQGWVYLTADGFYLPAKDPHPDETRVLDLVQDVLHGLGDSA
jgi:hypothetical protein